MVLQSLQMWFSQKLNAKTIADTIVVGNAKVDSLKIATGRHQQENLTRRAARKDQEIMENRR